MNSKPPLPWIAHPYIPKGSIGWRMGDGEHTYTLFYQWFSDLSDFEAKAFERNSPEPDDWRGTYSMIRTHPWK